MGRRPRIAAGALAGVALAATGAWLLFSSPPSPAPGPDRPPVDLPDPEPRPEPAPMPPATGAGARAAGAFAGAARSVSATAGEAAARLEALAVGAEAILALPPSDRVAAAAGLAELAASSPDPAVWRPAFAVLDRIFRGDLPPEARAAAFEGAGRALLNLLPLEEPADRARIAARLLGEMSTPAATAALVERIRETTHYTDQFDESERRLYGPERVEEWREENHQPTNAARAAVAGLYRIADPDSAELLAGVLRSSAETPTVDEDPESPERLDLFAPSPPEEVAMDGEAVVRALVRCGLPGIRALDGLLVGPEAVSDARSRRELAIWTYRALADAGDVRGAREAIQRVRGVLDVEWPPPSPRNWSLVPPAARIPTPEDLREVLRALADGRIDDAHRLAAWKEVTGLPVAETESAILEALAERVVQAPGPPAERAFDLLRRIRTPESRAAAVHRLARVFAEESPADDGTQAASFLWALGGPPNLPEAEFARLVVPPLLESLGRDEGTPGREQAAYFLAELGVPRATGAVAAAVREGTLHPKFLTWLRGPGAVEMLVEFARTDREGRVGSFAIYALGRCGREGRDALADLLEEEWTRDADGRPNARGRQILETLLESFASEADLQVVERELARFPGLLSELSPLSDFLAMPPYQARTAIDWIDANPGSALDAFLLFGLAKTDYELPEGIRRLIDELEGR